MISDFLHLIFPRVCAACDRALYRHEECLCTFCRYRLPKTGFHLFRENPVIRMFWGRVEIKAATSCYRYKKGTRVQKMIHRLKYKGEKEIGIFLGKSYGKELLQSETFKDLDLIVPVPLHPSRLRTRGYNQSESFGEGLSESMHVWMDPEALYRTERSKTQTQRSRYNRWENVENKFAVRDPETLKGKNILLVDDVITTGATLESCASVLLEIPGTSVSIATIASTLN